MTLTRRMVLVLAAACVLAVAAKPSSAASVRPTPKDWDQWQPTLDRSDLRLERPVSVWEANLGLGDLLSRLSDQSSVSMSVAEDFEPLSLTAFIEGASLDAIMLGLADLYDGYWAYPRGSEGASRAYCLVIEIPRAWDSHDEFLRYRRNAVMPKVAPRYAREREDRLALYERALEMPSEKLLEQYEDTDPWLCADVLDPVRRPVIERILRLDSASRQALVTRCDSPTRPVSSLEPSFQQDIRRWVDDPSEWGGWSRFGRDYGPGFVPRYSDRSERLRHATLRYSWWSDQVQMTVELPDEGGLSLDVMHGSRDLAEARRKLIRLGYREETPEYAARISEESRAWQLETADVGPSEPPHFWLSRVSDESDPRLAYPLDLSSLDGDSMPLTPCLEEIARQCGLQVLAHALAPHRPDWTNYSVRRESLDGSRTGAILNAARSSFGFWWRFRGDVLTIRDPSYPIFSYRLSKEFISWVQTHLRAGSTVPIDDFASFIATLNRTEINALWYVPHFTENGWGGPAWLPLGIYGSLDDSQRALARAAGLPFGALNAHQRGEQRRFIADYRPYLKLREDDLLSARLHLEDTVLEDGEPGIRFTVSYGFRDAPGLTDVLFTSPLSITVPELPEWARPAHDEEGRTPEEPAPSESATRTPRSAE